MTDLGWLNTAALVAVFAAAEYARSQSPTSPPTTLDRRTRRVIHRYERNPMSHLEFVPGKGTCLAPDEGDHTHECRVCQTTVRCSLPNGECTDHPGPCDPADRGFWEQIKHQMDDLLGARTAADVVRICRPIEADVAAYVQPGHGFFQGSGGDYDMREPLREAGWTTVWCRARYYWAMLAPDGNGGITYIEGDVYPTIKVPS